MYKYIILLILLATSNVFVANAQYSEAAFGSREEVEENDSISSLSNEISEYAKLSQYSSLGDLKSFLVRYPSSRFKEEVNNYIALNLAGEFCSLSTDKDYQEAKSYASGETIITVQEAINQNEATKKFIKKQKLGLKLMEDGGVVNFVIEWANFAWNGREQDGLFQYNFGIKLKFGNQKHRVQMAFGPKFGVGVWDFKRVYRKLKPGESPNNRFKNFFQLPLEVEMKLNLAHLNDKIWLFLDGRFDYYAVRKKEVQRPMSVNAGIGFARPSSEYVFFYGRELGNINSKYSDLFGYANPFMSNRLANYFGFSISLVL